MSAGCLHKEGRGQAAAAEEECRAGTTLEQTENNFKPSESGLMLLFCTFDSSQ